MAQLPFEILRLTFSHLRRSELLQCQLTSKLWYDASVELLYSEVYIPYNETSIRFIRTLSSSSRLCSYLKKIRTDDLFRNLGETILWDKHGLLNKLIEECPNITSIESRDIDDRFWIKMAYAASRGQLSRLQHLPDGPDRSLEYYIYTALAFKNSLIDLRIVDSHSLYGPDLSMLNEYQTLCDQISLFANLRSLYIKYKSDKQLSDFDTLIEDCKSLKKLDFLLYSWSSYETMMEFNITGISPHPNIDTLNCNPELLNQDSQLRYLVHKFPNLQCLQATYNTYTSRRVKVSNCSYSSLINFFRYTKNIPKLKISMDINLQDFISIWVQLVKENVFNRDLTMAYFDNDGTSDSVALDLSKEGLKITFPTYGFYASCEELPHIRVLSVIGNMILSLKLINSTGRGYAPLYRRNTNLTLDCLQLCPLLQEFKFPWDWTNSNPNNEKSLAEFEHTELKSLHIAVVHKTSLDYIKHMVVNTPNLNRICISSGRTYTNSPVKLNIANLSFDTLIWEFYYDRWSVESTYPLLIRCNINSHREKRFFFFEGHLIPTECKHLCSIEYSRLDIVCKSLKEIIVTTIKPSYTARVVL